MFSYLLCVAIHLSAADASATGLPPPKHGVYVVAHRGAHRDIPENTLAAYEKAIELGADFVEIDVRTTKDGRFVSVHNSDLSAYTDGKVTAKVKDFTLEELRAIDIGSRVGPQWKDERVPTVEEILDLCQGRIGIYLDLKEASVAPLVEMIKSRGMEKAVLWYADIDELRQVRELCPECIPMPDPGPAENLPALLETFKPEVVASVWKYYGEAFAERCHEAGALVIVDESGPECWEEALEWRTDGIQTDHPGELIAFLKQKAGPAAAEAPGATTREKRE